MQETWERKNHRYSDEELSSFLSVMDNRYAIVVDCVAFTSFQKPRVLNAMTVLLTMALTSEGSSSAEKLPVLSVTLMNVMYNDYSVM